jgi:hypothetical protein
MSVYNDMANDAGCRFGTDENRQMAEMIEAEEYRKQCEHDEERRTAEAEEEPETADNSSSIK